MRIRVRVDSVSAFDADRKVVEATLAYTTGRWWKKEAHEDRRRFLTTYGHVWYWYPNGSRVKCDLEGWLGTALGEFETREVIDAELEL